MKETLEKLERVEPLTSEERLEQIERHGMLAVEAELKYKEKELARAKAAEKARVSWGEGEKRGTKHSM